MDKSILKQIRQFADILPSVMELCNMKIMGSELLKKDKNAKDKKGNPILPHNIYTINARVERNHYRRLKKIYASQGEEGLKQYAKQMGQLKNSTTAN